MLSTARILAIHSLMLWSGLWYLNWCILTGCHHVTDKYSWHRVWVFYNRLCTHFFKSFKLFLWFAHEKVMQDCFKSSTKDRLSHLHCFFHFLFISWDRCPVRESKRDITLIWHHFLINSCWFYFFLITLFLQDCNPLVVCSTDFSVIKSTL